MQQPSKNDAAIYWAIVGVSALLCFAWMMTGSFWLTMAVMILGLLHLARHFPHVEAWIANDPLLLWVRAASPLIILVIFGIALMGSLLRQ